MAFSLDIFQLLYHYSFSCGSAAVESLCLLRSVDPNCFRISIESCIKLNEARILWQVKTNSIATFSNKTFKCQQQQGSLFCLFVVEPGLSLSFMTFVYTGN